MSGTTASPIANSASPSGATGTRTRIVRLSRPALTSAGRTCATPLPRRQPPHPAGNVPQRSRRLPRHRLRRGPRRRPAHRAGAKGLAASAAISPNSCGDRFAGPGAILTRVLRQRHRSQTNHRGTDVHAAAAQTNSRRRPDTPAGVLLFRLAKKGRPDWPRLPDRLAGRALLPSARIGYRMKQPHPPRRLLPQTSLMPQPPRIRLANRTKR